MVTLSGTERGAPSSFLSEGVTLKSVLDGDGDDDDEDDDDDDEFDAEVYP